MAGKSSTYREHLGDGHYVTVQYCEFVDSNGYCNEYLGYSYPSTFCTQHNSARKHPSISSMKYAMSLNRAYYIQGFITLDDLLELARSCREYNTYKK